MRGSTWHTRACQVGYSLRAAGSCIASETTPKANSCPVVLWSSLQVALPFHGKQYYMIKSDRCAV